MGRIRGDVLADRRREVPSKVRKMIRVCTPKVYVFRPWGVPYRLPGSLCRWPSLLRFASVSRRLEREGGCVAWGSEPRRERGGIGVLIPFPPIRAWENLR